MTEETLIAAIETRMGNKVELIENQWGRFLLFDSIQSPGTKVLSTIGLSLYEMPVHEKHKGEEHCELYFQLPSYWNLKATENPNFNWVFYWLNRLKHFVIEHHTWFAHGHTMPCGKDKKPLSETMQQNAFLLTRPIELHMDLAPFQVEETLVHFLAILPLYSDELDYKMAKGTVKMMEKFKHVQVTEKLDDFRKSVVRSKWSLFRK